jgi:hypothetical protein
MVIEHDQQTELQHRHTGSVFWIMLSQNCFWGPFKIHLELHESLKYLGNEE